MSRSGLLAGSVLLLVLLSPITLVTFADVGPGFLSEVLYCKGETVPIVCSGPNPFFVVVPGGSYQVVITGITDYTGSVSVFIKGKHQDGTPWIIELKNQIIVEGKITSDCFTIPSDAGCTIVVAYYHQGHLAAQSQGSNNPGHMKTYYDDKEPFDNPIPCEGEKVPEFPLAPEAIAALSLVSWTAVRRRRKH